LIPESTLYAFIRKEEYHLGVSDLNRIRLIKLGWMEDVLIG
jgi:hypothetical protein